MAISFPVAVVVLLFSIGTIFFSVRAIRKRPEENLVLHMFVASAGTVGAIFGLANIIAGYQIAVFRGL